MAKRFALLIGAAALGVMALGAQTAASVPALASHTARHFDSGVTIHRDPTFHGQVVSSEHACEVQRMVVLYKFRGSSEGGDRKRLGKDRTNDRGKWKIDVKESRRGSVQTHAEPRGVRGTAGTLRVCRGDNSRLLNLRN